MINLMGFQDSATPVMEGIVDLHNHICFFLVLLTVFVCWVFGNVVYDFLYSMQFPASIEQLKRRESMVHVRGLTHGATIEIIWTLIPSLVLVFIAIPSFALLYSMDEVIGPWITLKVLGHQWYWSYEYSDYNRDRILLLRMFPL